jgi:hypothetical protein
MCQPYFRASNKVKIFYATMTGRAETNILKGHNEVARAIAMAIEFLYET